MRIHVLQHVPFEDIGGMADWFASRNAKIEYTRFFENGLLPAKQPDLLIIMGGPMSVNDEAAFPWLRMEKEYVLSAIRGHVPVLGICLGAQLIAAALGARVYRNSQKEIGWFSVEGIPGAVEAFSFPPSFLAFHWHGETFDLPDGSIHLARNAACENQAFRIGRNVIGLQFHIEMLANNIQLLIDNCRDDLQPGGPFVQTEMELQSVSGSVYRNSQKLMDNVLSHLTASS